MLETAERNATSPAVKSDMAPATTPRLMDRVRDRIRVMHYAYATTLDIRTIRDYIRANAATTAGEFDSSVYVGGQPPQAVFLRPLHGMPFFGRVVREGVSPAGANYRSVNPHVRALPFDSGKRDPQTLSWSTAMTPAKNPSVETVRSLFGEHPEDVISPIKSAADALTWLEEILHTISREALNERNGYRIKHLADAGAFLALDMDNYAGHRYETMIDSLRTAGVVPADVNHD